MGEETEEWSERFPYIVEFFSDLGILSGLLGNTRGEGGNVGGKRQRVVF